MTCGTKTRPRKVTKAAVTTISSSRADPIKAFVIAHFWQLAAVGLAEWIPMRDGNVEFRLPSGEAFLLGHTSITRVA
jgi:hypothetical protein